MSREHVVPRWLLRRHNLHSLPVTFSNGTTVNLSRLLAPACIKCNTGFLSRMERAVIRRFAEKDVQNDPNLIGSWCAKILYTIYYRAGLLRIRTDGDRRTRALSVNIIQDLHQVRNIALTGAMTAASPESIHSSVIVLPCRTDVPQGPFDLFDLLAENSVALRIGRYGLIACLGDGGLTARYFGSDLLDAYAQEPLTPFRFRAVAAQFFSLRAHLQIPPPLIFSENPGKGICFVCSVPPLNRSEFWNKDFDRDLLRTIHSHIMQLPRDAISFSDSGTIDYNVANDHPLSEQRVA